MCPFRHYKKYTSCIPEGTTRSGLLQVNSGLQRLFGALAPLAPSAIQKAATTHLIQQHLGQLWLADTQVVELLDQSMSAREEEAT